MSERIGVSVIITTFGGSAKLSRAISSVLNQSYQDFEIIVVDDNNPGSTGRKKTESIMNPFLNNDRLIYIKHEHNRNGAAARNTGIKVAKGDYIAFLDDDDYFHPNRLTALLNAVEKHNVDGACSGVVLEKKGKIVGLHNVKEGHILLSNELIENQNTIGTGSNIFVKRNIVQTVNGFDESFLRFQDVEFMMRVAKVSKIVFISDYLVTKDQSDARQQNYSDVKRSLNYYFQKFENEINEAPESIRTAFLIDRHKYLLVLAILTDEKYVDEERRILEELTGTSWIEFIRKEKMMKICRTFFGPIYSLIRSIRNEFRQARFTKLIRTMNKC